MSSTREQLLELHHHAVNQLSRKFSKIPKTVFHNNRHPTIHDIYTGNTSAIYVPSIPAHLQLDFVLANFERFAAAKFMVDKKHGDPIINQAIWYWEMDKTHSFTRRQRQVRFNILMACIVRASTNPLEYVTPAALALSKAFIDAWLYAVTRQDESSKQSEFLDMWANGPFDLVFWGRQASARMDKAVKQLEQYVPKATIPMEGQLGFWQEMHYTSPNTIRKFGTAWAMKWTVWVDEGGKEIDKKHEEVEADEGLESGTLMAAFDNAGLAGPSYLSDKLFQRPLVQSVLREMDEEMTDPVADQAHRDKVQPAVEDMWMDPVVALEILQGTSARFENLKQFFDKVAWE
ncbi:hypothetical protein BKA63DRAFT_549228 [Paraphoma chrysanthemicola]|nr:hypothetical protein BKA63DRAFT_549228 [Paraphoma chrysanthemicola]